MKANGTYLGLNIAQPHLAPPIRCIWHVDRLLTAHNMILSCVVPPFPSPTFCNYLSAVILLIPQSGQSHLQGIYKCQCVCAFVCMYAISVCVCECVCTGVLRALSFYEINNDELQIDYPGVKSSGF